MAITVVNDWNTTTGISDAKQTVSATAGNWLVAVVTWKSQASAVQPSINVGDNGRNLWSLLATRSVQANNTFVFSPTAVLNCQVWACPAVAYAGWPALSVFTAIQSFTGLDIGSVAIKLVEVAGMGNGFLTVDSVTLGQATAATNFTLTVPAPSGGVDCLQVAAAAGDIAYGSYTTTGTGWAQLSNVTNTNPEVGLFAAWREGTTGSSVTFGLLGGATRLWAGVIVAIRQTGVPPAQPNPNWPATEMQLGLGYDLSSPLSGVWWTTLQTPFPSVSAKRGIQYELGTAQAEPTDIVLRNSDGALTPKTAVTATASAPGTTTTILIPDASASGIAVGDFFRLYTGAGVLKEFTVFKVVSLASASGTTTITFTAADGSGPALAATGAGDVFQGTPVDLYTPYRLVMSWGGKRHVVSAGWAESWPQVWDASGMVGEITMTGTGALANLTAANPTCLAGEITRRNPYAYWKLSDAGGAPVAVNSSARSTTQLVVTTSKNGAGSGSADFGAGTQGASDNNSTPPIVSSLLGDPGNGWQQTGLTSADLNAGKGAALIATDVNFPSIAGGVTIYFVHYVLAADFTAVNGATVDPTVVMVRNTDPGAGAQGSVIKFGWKHSTGNPRVTVWDKATHASTGTDCTSGGQWASPSFFISGALVFNQTSWTAYSQNGQLAGSGTCNLASSFSILNVGGEADRFFNGNCCPGIFTHVAVFDRMLTANEISQLDSAMSAMPAELTTARVQRKLDVIGSRSGRLLSADGAAAASYESADASTVADACSQVGGYEDALVFEDAAGNYQYRPPQMYGAQVSRAVLGERADLGEVPYLAGVESDFDMTYLYNQITVTNVTKSQAAFDDSMAETPFVAIDQVSVLKRMPRTLDRTVRLYYQQAAFYLANWLLSQYSSPKQRIASVTIDPASNPSLWLFCLTVEVGDLVTVMRRPLTASPISLQCVVLQVEQKGAPGVWQTTLTLGVARPSQLVLNDSVRGVVGSNVMGLE